MRARFRRTPNRRRSRSEGNSGTALQYDRVSVSGAVRYNRPPRGEDRAVAIEVNTKAQRGGLLKAIKHVIGNHD